MLLKLQCCSCNPSCGVVEVVVVVVVGDVVVAVAVVQL